MKIRFLPEDRPLFFDGAMGTMLQSSGITGWNLPEELNLTNPDLICRVHTQYLDSGCDVITTNTFGANRVKLAHYGYDTQEVIRKAVGIARKAVSAYKKKYVAFDMGSTGRLTEPMGDLSFDEAYAVFAEAARAAENAGADLIIIETMSDFYELKAAVIAARQSTSLPVIASVAFQDGGRMLTGADVLTVATCAEAWGADAVGFNCGGDLAQAAILTEAFLAAATVPVVVQPNAGLPQMRDGKTCYDVTPEEFARAQKAAATAGARILGGCCGTTPKHIAALVRTCSSINAAAQAEKRIAARPAGAARVTSYSRTVVIGGDLSTAGGGPKIIGERINPTGKKRFKQALEENDIGYILNEGCAQAEHGADILDVNVGLPGIDERTLMGQAVRALQRTLPLPLQIDTTDPAVMEEALRAYNGKPLVNSVNGKASVMDAVFPLIKKYGTAVVALTLDENGIPDTAEGRLDIAERIVERAGEYGIRKEDIIIDTLTLAVSSRQEESAVTLRAAALVREKLGLPVVLGVSNVSFGLPRRELVNSAFLALALQSGLSACIVNPLSAPMMDTFRSWRALAGYDAHCLEYIASYAGTASQPAAEKTGASSTVTAAAGMPSSGNEAAGTGGARETIQRRRSLRDIITGGFRDEAEAAATLLLETADPLDIINDHVIPALDEVGKDFESGRKFLPQLLLSADTVSRAFEVIKKRLAQTGAEQASKGTIILATVYGDIHDIGKNIVRSMLENYGYRVVDLGKNVSPETIVDCAGREKPGLIGLSALMTTTVPAMEQTIQALRTAGVTAKIMAGGAVLTEDYAMKIGADYYAADAMASVAIAKSLFQI